MARVHCGVQVNWPAPQLSEDTLVLDTCRIFLDFTTWTTLRTITAFSCSQTYYRSRGLNTDDTERKNRASLTKLTALPLDIKVVFIMMQTVFSASGLAQDHEFVKQQYNESPLTLVQHAALLLAADFND